VFVAKLANSLQKESQLLSQAVIIADFSITIADFST
jgi:hypothetical protein